MNLASISLAGLALAECSDDRFATRKVKASAAHDEIAASPRVLNAISSGVIIFGNGDEPPTIGRLMGMMGEQ